MGILQSSSVLQADLQLYLRDELTAFPERIREPLLKRALDYRNSPERFASHQELTARTLVKLIEEWAIGMMTPGEKQDRDIFRMSDRALLEAVYRKLYVA